MRLDNWKASGREVSIAGLGKSGVAATRLLLHNGVRIYLSDASSGEKAQAAAAQIIRDVSAEPFALSIETGGHNLERIAKSAGLVLSPGIPPTADVVRAATAAGIDVVAEAQVGLDALNGVPCVAITGTNGKTTTTALTDHLFRSGGKRSFAAGNIGLPICEVALDPNPIDFLVAELSSFQLHDMPDLRPAVGVLTNLAPDHLDRYPAVDEYYADKARLFKNASVSSTWVSNLDDAESRKMLSGVQGRHLSFSVTNGRKADAWFDRSGNTLMLGAHPVLPRNELHLLGDHNVANALAATLATHALGLSLTNIASGLRNFRPLTHRLEPVREVNGVQWINDSKATNVASTEVAVRGMTRPFVLLLGGRHKGQPYTDLIEPLHKHGVAVVAYGEAGDLIEKDLKEEIRVVRGGSFEDVISKAQDLAPRGGAVLLSPACSSFDMFTGYDARGAAFRSLVEAM